MHCVWKLHSTIKPNLMTMLHTFSRSSGTRAGRWNQYSASTRRRKSHDAGGEIIKRRVHSENLRVWRATISRVLVARLAKRTSNILVRVTFNLFDTSSANGVHSNFQNWAHKLSLRTSNNYNVDDRRDGGLLGFAKFRRVRNGGVYLSDVVSYSNKISMPAEIFLTWPIFIYLTAMQKIVSGSIANIIFNYSFWAEKQILCSIYENCRQKQDDYKRTEGAENNDHRRETLLKKVKFFHVAYSA